jgi:GNAT superfamily N-acetyltransferase
MGSSLTIKPAGPGDAGQILEFIRELAQYERLAHEVVATEEAISSTLFGARPAAEVVIAEWDGQPAGFALFFPTYSTFLAKAGIWLEDLYVRQEFRGRGIGERLLSHLAMLTLERDCGRLEWAVLDWNRPAIDFYSRLGAEAQDQWTTWRLVDENLKDLAQQ